MTVRLDGPGGPSAPAGAPAPAEGKRAAGQGESPFAALLAAIMAPPPGNPAEAATGAAGTEEESSQVAAVQAGAQAALVQVVGAQAVGMPAASAEAGSGQAPGVMAVSVPGAGAQAVGVQATGIQATGAEPAGVPATGAQPGGPRAADGQAAGGETRLTDGSPQGVAAPKFGSASASVLFPSAPAGAPGAPVTAAPSRTAVQAAHPEAGAGASPAALTEDPAALAEEARLMDAMHQAALRSQEPQVGQPSAAPPNPPGPASQPGSAPETVLAAEGEEGRPKTAAQVQPLSVEADALAETGTQQLQAGALPGGTETDGDPGADHPEKRHAGRERGEGTAAAGTQEAPHTESLQWTAAAAPEARGGGAPTTQPGGAAAGAAPSLTLFQQQEPVSVDRALDLVVEAAGEAADGEYAVTLRLHPASLGEVRLQLHLVGREVQTVFQVTTPEAREALEQRGDQLRQGLTDAGFTLSGFTVSTGGGQRQGWERQETAEWLWLGRQDRAEPSAGPVPQQTRRPGRVNRSGVLDTLA